jgi:hypothetical protein
MTYRSACVGLLLATALAGCAPSTTRVAMDMGTCPWAGSKADAFSRPANFSTPLRQGSIVATGVRQSQQEVASLLNQAVACGWAADLTIFERAGDGFRFEIKLADR